ncbi:hybrid sensor histidine kinase/response regulator [Paramesorhizobium deserti]|uniref:histidine kinase n=1 Tax=Paramesorhizobium deserti TaxID=1494590 RepID=A0A135HNF4_9HYPH|nr:PAS domain-containing hybrid sensor histidine kinase/response regulator [Paramesorhizobium deserti]KXF74741.1 hybrid sensor histidine kinase/response regulator [Paramesorhizobium deserti]
MNQLIEDLEDLFDNAPCGYVSTGPGGHIIMANRIFADWLGRARSDIIGRRFQDFLNIAGKMYYETHFAPLMRMQGFFHEVALDLVRADGSKLPVLVNAVERRDEKGALSFVRITIFNASDRRRYERELLEARRCAEKANAELQNLNRTLEERIAEAVEARMKSEAALRQAQKMEAVGQLTGGIAHDFNNMLAVVFSALNLLERRLAKGEDVSHFIAAAKDGAGRAAALTQRLLAFSRQQALAPEPICANQMVAGMSDLLHHTLGEMVRLETVLAEDLWQVLADKNVLENVVLNLAINARDAMPHGGRLVIETANSHLDEAYGAEHDVKPGQYVMVAVTDTGVGMSPEVMAKAFDPFFTTKEPGRGTGLGLSQVFGFVKQSEGHITVNSALGRGTSITIYLPRYSGAPEARNHSEAQMPVCGNGSETVLVVEDDEQVLTLTAQMLRDLGYHVVEARCGEEALGALSAVPAIGLLFTDVVMPDINGLRLAEAALERRPDLKILFTTGYSRDAVVHNRLLDPGVNLLQKPASLEQLAAKVRTLLDG